jgi:hypothetical protein
MRPLATPTFYTLAILALLTACGPKTPPAEPEALPAAEAPAAKMAAPATDAWLGKWTGVEGNVLDIVQGVAPGHYKIAEGTLDGPLNYDGVADGATIKFEQDGKAQAIKAGTGAETGLKWLAEKQNCLVIESGRGFCRD